MNHILITDVQYRKEFDNVSIIKKLFPNEHLILGTIKSALFCKLAYGRCSVEKLRTEDGKDAFFHDFKILLEKYGQDKIIYVPGEEQTTDYVAEYLGRYVQGNVVCLLPSYSMYKLFRNKRSLNHYCLEYGFPAPKEYKVEDLPAVEYPVLLKPEIGSGSHGQYRLYKKEDYTDEIKTALSKEPYLIQELLPNGKEVQGGFFLCHKGKVIGAYTHKRIRTSPEEGGVTVLSCLNDNPQLINQGIQLLEHAGWEGLIMLEYIYDDRSGEYKLIEANPRIWGSIMLSEYSGANLLQNYIRICLGLPIEKIQMKKEAFIRWFFPVDLLNWIKKKGKIKDFWNFKNTCVINWTYARKDRALLFILMSVFNMHNLKNLFGRA
ncbi:ATP-grasp domain-containing protein [uncultured Prevotella sp.]|uniref:ATP-binding protein n=1 Tax=uncultured Prevotella sp. TaxID=159272 RepID=UPI0025E17A3F|nr:ATP-grasp domain-containing protein [uncultured Prevotella sp.]